MEKRELHGVGGWLAFLVIGLMFLGPLISLGITASDLARMERDYPNLMGNSDWKTLKILTWGGMVTQVAFTFTAGFRLSNSFNPASVRFAIFTLWFVAVGLPVAQFYAVTSFTRLDGDDIRSDLARWIGQSLLWAIIWTAYLVRSKRVKNTYYGINSAISDGTDSEPKNRMSFGERWRKLPVERRQAVFFSGCWIAFVVVWASFFDEDTTYYFQDGWNLDWAKVMSWALLPPAIYFALRWIYAKFVIAGSDKDPA